MRERMEQARERLERERAAARTARRRRLASMAQRYETVANDARYKKISDLYGFATLHRGLQQYLVPPLERRGRLVLIGLLDFQLALNRHRTGPSWRKYFVLEELIPLLDSGNQWTPDESELLITIYERFEKINDDPQYEIVSEMNGFHEAHEALAALIMAMDEELADDEPLPEPPPTDEPADDGAADEEPLVDPPTTDTPAQPDAERDDTETA
jgi:hypothetical protein